MSRIARKHRNWRCVTCGVEFSFKQGHGLESFIPPAHDVGKLAITGRNGCDGSNHPAIAWTTGMFNAYVYVLRQSAEGVDLSRWLNESDVEKLGRYWPGCTKPELTVALDYARRWKQPEFREGQLPKSTTPAGLFG